MNADQMLLILLAEIEVFAELPDDLPDPPEPYLYGLQTAGVPYRPAAWLGGPLPPAPRMACSRAAQRLARAGLVRRITEARRDRVRYLQPTADGLVRALELAGRDADKTAVVEGLRRTQWGRGLARRVGRIGEVSEATG